MSFHILLLAIAAILKKGLFSKSQLIGLTETRLRDWNRPCDKEVLEKVILIDHLVQMPKCKIWEGNQTFVVYVFLNIHLRQ